MNRPGRCLSSDNLSVASDGSSASLPNLRQSRSLARRVLACTLDTEVVPDVVEIHINPVILRKGFLNFMEETSRGWIKRWVVSNVRGFRFSSYFIQPFILWSSQPAVWSSSSVIVLLWGDHSWDTLSGMGIQIQVQIVYYVW